MSEINVLKFLYFYEIPLIKMGEISYVMQHHCITSGGTSINNNYCMQTYNIMADSRLSYLEGISL
jgi:hypothetical protein